MLAKLKLCDSVSVENEYYMSLNSPLKIYKENKYPECQSKETDVTLSCFLM